jgi:hypothetical protein
MKKVFLLLLLVCGVSWAQESFEVYNSSYFKKDYTITISQKEDKTVSFYLQTNSMDKLSKNAMIILNSENLEEFKSFVLSLKDTYTKWYKTAVDNKVAELSKEVEYKKLSFNSAFLYGKWNFDFSTSLSAKFRVVNNQYLMIIQSDALESSNNQFIKSDGFVIVFNSEKEFDDLLLKLDNNKALAFFDVKKSKDDLFKN